MEDLFGEFEYLFEQLTSFEQLPGRKPYPWQAQLYRDLMADQCPTHVQAPTGAGKTSLMAVWLIALCQQAREGLATKLPRRLVWVVNRRVVVDQATAVAERLAQKASEMPVLKELLEKLGGGLPGPPMAVSTLRGEFADNREWSMNPARAAIIVGTVDMVGSRLLFSGYGDGRARRAHHAGLLGQDALIVNDEAHLSPAFAKLLEQIPQVFQKKLRPWRAMRLSATQQGSATKYPPDFRQDCESSEEFRKRYEAVKRLEVIGVADTKTQESKMLELALEGDDRRVVVFFREPGKASKFAAALVKKDVKPEQVVLLTGTQRGHERDLMARDGGGLARFQGEGEERMYLVATSAGEVGIDLSGTRLVTSLDTAEHLIQRFGRLNRFGEAEEARAYVVYTPLKPGKDEDLLKALDFLQQLGGDASARRLFEMDEPIPFPAEPLMAPLNGWQFGRWSFTSVEKARGVLPEVEPYLHGQQEDLPRTTLAWRWEVDFLTERTSVEQAQEALRAHALRAREKLEVPTREAREYLAELAERYGGDRKALVVDSRGAVSSVKLERLGEERQERDLRYATVVLPAALCHLENGMLGSVKSEPAIEADVADWDAEGDADGGRQRFLLRQEEDDWLVLRPNGEIAVRFDVNYLEWCNKENWRVKKFVRLEDAEQLEETDQKPEMLLFVEPKAASTKGIDIPLDEHQTAVGEAAGRMARAVGLELLADLYTAAGQKHDLGKICERWKQAMGIPLGKDLAKTRLAGNPRELGGYRHELGSLLRVEAMEELGRHLIATHHGRGRGYFEPKAFEPGDEKRSRDEAEAQTRRFQKLQCEYGHYELAYLETLLRAADWLISSNEAGEQTDHV